MNEQGYAVGAVVGEPTVALVNGDRVVQVVLDCGSGKRVSVEGPVAIAECEAGRVVAGEGAALLRHRAGSRIGVAGEVCFAPVHIRARKTMARPKARPVVSLPFGPFLFVGYRRSGRGGTPEADIALLGGERLRVVLPQNVFAQPGSYLLASLSWSRRNGWRAPYRLVNVCAWRPPKMDAIEAA